MTDFVAFLLFPVVWCAMCYGLGRFSGWARLAERFQAPGRFEGPTSPFCSANMGAGFQPVNYGTCLTLGADASGLYLDVFPLFRVGHPPLLIPWREVRVGERKKAWMMEMVTLHLGRADDVPIQLYAKTAEKLLAERPVAR